VTYSLHHIMEVKQGCRVKSHQRCGQVWSLLVGLAAATGLLSVGNSIKDGIAYRQC
jgi:hypothetical protein